MANPRRYNGLTRTQQQARNKRKFRQMQNNGYAPNMTIAPPSRSSQNRWNTNAGYAANSARVIQAAGVQVPSGMTRVSNGVVGFGTNSGYAAYGDQKRNANSRASYRNVRAAFGLSVS